MSVQRVSSGPVLSLENVSKTYGLLAAVTKLDLAVQPGELLTLLGPSGSGKTTTLMMIGGLIYPDAGRVLLSGADITYMPPQFRNMGVVFQSYALFPHMSVLENVSFPLRARGLGVAAAHEQARAALAITRLERFETRLPSELSGGQQQRVALARALVFQPPVLLMDEPLGALDKNLRAEMQHEIRQIQRQLGFSIVHVTHDQEEALAMSDRVAVMSEGRLRQIGSPKSLYMNPVDSFVASFLGEANLLTIRITGSEGLIKTAMLSNGSTVKVSTERGLAAGDEAILCIRPEVMVVGGGGVENAQDGIVESIRYGGDSSMLVIEVMGAIRIKAKVMRLQAEIEAGSRIQVTWRMADGLVIER